MSLSAAQTRVKFAKEDLETGHVDDSASQLDAAELFLQGLDDELAAPVRAQIAEIRARLTARIAPQDELAIRGARLKLKQVLGWIELRYDPADVEHGLRAAEEFVVNVPELYKAQVLEEIAAFRGRTVAGTAEPEGPLISP